MKKRLLPMVIMSLFAVKAMAQNAKDTFSYKAGRFTVTLLSEGQQSVNSSLLIGATEDMLQRYAPEGSVPNAINAFMVQQGGKTMLVDTGIGRKLMDNLAGAGVTPEQVSVILLTHTHGDHTGGLLKDGKAAFPNARIYISQPEYKWWSAKDESKNIIAAYEGRIETFAIEQEEFKMLFDGVFACGAFGHTPGHVAYLVGDWEDMVVIWGDLTHAMAIQMPYPDISLKYDSDPSEAARIRNVALGKVVGQNVVVAGMHIPFPAMGYISRGEGSGYIFRPLE